MMMMMNVCFDFEFPSVALRISSASSAAGCRRRIKARPRWEKWPVGLRQQTVLFGARLNDKFVAYICGLVPILLPRSQYSAPVCTTCRCHDCVAGLDLSRPPPPSTYTGPSYRKLEKQAGGCQMSMNLPRAEQRTFTRLSVLTTYRHWAL